MGMDEKQTSNGNNSVEYSFEDEQYELNYDPIKMKGKKEVDIEVWKYDIVGFDDLIGSASVDILPSMNKELQVELFLQSKQTKKDQTQQQLNISSQQNDEGLGKVIFHMKYISEQDHNLQKEQQKQEKKNEQNKEQEKEKEYEQQQQQDNIYPPELEHVKGTIKFKNLSITNIPDFYKQNTNLYIRVILGQNERKTQIIDPANVSDFNEEFQFEFDPVVIIEREMMIEVWNKKNESDISGDEFLGGTSSLFLSFLSNPGSLDLRIVGDQDIAQIQFDAKLSLNVAYSPDNEGQSKV
ncbi:MAG: hypothetical protein EZS28_006457 [Streblomastix strix]|uniref:C2 domain-containing protein n=1 Tax=Streblomastix strix TaxID=222440 RepID=A0A5J4WSA3_9EUKA|nr:MAG: hypothetical protein EZS28_006457 [Streblomastix strix]